MTTLAIDSLGVPFALLVLLIAAVWLGAIVLIGRILSLNDRNAMAPVMVQRREQEARERALAMREGPLSEWAAESLEKRQRAELRHAQRLNERNNAA